MIPTTDRRHGSNAGYMAGCRLECCRRPHSRFQKMSRVRLANEGPQAIPAAPVVRRLRWWQARGVTIQAVSTAASLGYGTLAELDAGERDVCLRSTVRAALAVRWDDLPGNSLCAADLTRYRIYSMMAAGHPLLWITNEVGNGLPISGAWRHQQRVTIAIARKIQTVYDQAPLDGPSKHSAVKARNRGHQHPLAWDDPGVPAMPFGWTPYNTNTSALVGRPEVIATRVEDADWFADQGMSLTQVLDRLNVKHDTFRDNCTRNGREDLYWRLSAREPGGDKRAATKAGIDRAREAS